MNVPKKQHFVPKSYLGGFTNPEKEDRLWVFDKQGKPPRLSTPMNEGYERYTYQVEQHDGSVDKFSLNAPSSTELPRRPEGEIELRILDFDYITE